VATQPAAATDAGGNEGGGTQQPDAGMDDEGDVGMAPEEVDVAFDALGMHDLLAKYPRDEIHKRLHDSIVGLQQRLKVPRRV
jgi:hypothetical protein